MMDGGFFLPLPVNKPPDSNSVIRDCYKVISIGAEACIFHLVIILNGGLFLPLAVNKLPDFNGVINRRLLQGDFHRG